MRCDVSDQEVRQNVKDIYSVLNRDVQQNESQIRQLALDYQRFRERKHTTCSNGVEDVPEEVVQSAPPPVSQLTPLPVVEIAPPPVVASVTVPTKSSRKRRMARTPSYVATTMETTSTTPVTTETTLQVTSSIPMTTDTLESFHAVDFSHGTSDVVICTSRKTSFYTFLHNMDSQSFPLSTIIFKNRMQLHKFGLERIHDNNDVAWGFNKINAVWFGRNITTDRRFVCALVINEEYEPRFGHYLCLDRDIVELDVQPVPCFLKGIGYGSIRYCGTWNIERYRESSEEFMYVSKGRARSVVYKISLASYDDRWGVRA
tara:strand:- start:25078 stop:26025 length:948 start_codon:yes stop_codon:yes gene_type:complete